MEIFDFLFGRVVPALNEGVAVSIQLIVPAAALGIVFGVVIGTLRVYGTYGLDVAANAYAAVFRGTPLVCQLLFLYYGLPNVGIYLEPYGAAVIGFALCSAAYHSEYIRGGLLATRRGQLLAAQALGFSTWQSMLSIIVPQAVRRALPGCGNEIIYLIKYSSLAYIVTCMELTGQGKMIATQTFRFSEVFLVVGAYYLVIVTVATFLLRKLEDRLRIPGFGHA
ncbi:amino acid ABC transporter permease [Shumkonia mesophila]|uniref:amino acid ABC transporter permease n=1 Tax=Shumkonia mesophila TaxID=2838854 RepID=UPI002934B5E1|nr:amino acid ABC transporter permease [Shumkonia mesophila]